MLRFGKVLSPAAFNAEGGGASGEQAGTSAREEFSAVDCRIAGSGDGAPIRCLPVIPPWWPADFDMATGKKRV